MGRPSLEEVWQALEEVKDPEIPVLSLVELGVAREVAYEDGTLIVTLTPTFAGCPALHVIKQEVLNRLADLGADPVEVRMALSPSWTSDWISAEAREKLKAYGLAPPRFHGGDPVLIFAEQVDCPHCGSADTTVKNSFGPTPCRTIHYCNSCEQPFEGFKAL